MIPIIKPVMDEREADAARRVILSRLDHAGPRGRRVREGVRRVRRRRRTRCAVSNCTTALHLALLAVGVGPGDEVITVSHSFIATANVIRYCGATPVFVDIDPRHLQHRSRAASKRRSRRRPRAILLRAPDGHALRPRGASSRSRARTACRSSRTPPAPSAARSSGTASGRRSAAPHGDIACFSFHPRKVMTTGDGGMLTTPQRRLGRASSGCCASTA